MTADPRRLPACLIELLEGLADLLSVDQLILFGGAALDLLSDPTAPCQDLDLALPCASLTPARLARLGRYARSTGRLRRYWIRHSIPVIMVSAQWQDFLLDVNFLNEPNAIGHFDIETIMWEYPRRSYVDPHQLAWMPVRTIRLVSDLDADNPILLVNRLLKLSAKYGINLDQEQTTRDIAHALATRASAWNSADPFHGREAHEAHLRALPSAVRRSRDGVEFLRACVRTGLLDARLPALGSTLNVDPALAAQLAAAPDDVRFWKVADQAVAAGTSDWRRYATVTSISQGPPTNLEGARGAIRRRHPYLQRG